MTNEFVTEDYKDRLRDAAKQGRNNAGKCMVRFFNYLNIHFIVI